MSINYNQLTPACYAIANANDVDLGVGDSMLQNNIRLGRDEHKGTMVLPKAAVNDEFNAYIRKRQYLMKQLAPLWNDGDYQGMIDLMEATADPGPISEPAREEWEKEQEADEGEGEANDAE